jgi:hypothetical protein
MSSFEEKVGDLIVVGCVIDVKDRKMPMNR